MEPIERSTVGLSVDRFLRVMHRYDAGRTLPILHASKLTTAQIAALEFAREPRRVSDIATYLGLSRPATSQMIDKLAGKRLVLRIEGAADRRQRNVVLSARGRALVDRIAAARAARFDASLAVLDAAAAARFHSILEEVIARLEARRPTPTSAPPAKRNRKR
jgi:DNA-binding MarR family transcriptional regulator